MLGMNLAIPSESGLKGFDRRCVGFHDLSTHPERANSILAAPRGPRDEARFLFFLTPSSAFPSRDPSQNWREPKAATMSGGAGKFRRQALNMGAPGLARRKTKASTNCLICLSSEESSAFTGILSRLHPIDTPTLHFPSGSPRRSCLFLLDCS